MIEVRPGGRRRIDRVLSPAFTQGLATLAIDDLRHRRDDAAQEEADLSYLRRLLHARIDIVHAERRGRSGGAGALSVDELAAILADDETEPAAASGRYQSLEPSRAEAHRRHVEALIADADLSDVASLSDGELVTALTAYQTEEESVSQRHEEVAQVLARLNTEIGFRYARGETSVDDLLGADDE